MPKASTLFALAIIVTTASTGCQSHQAKVTDLQKQYDDAELQFRKDCSAELYKDPPTLSPKCADEDKQTKDLWARLQAERSKQ
jgi:hypothetical protein